MLYDGGAGFGIYQPTVLADMKELSAGIRRAKR